MKEPKNTEIENMVLAGLLNDDECYYKAVSEIERDYFTTEEGRFVFDELVEEKKSANVLMKSIKDPNKKSAIKIIDGTWTNKHDFDQSLESLKKIYKKRQLYYTINDLRERFDQQENDQLLDYLNKRISEFEYEDSGQNFIESEESALRLYSNFLELLENPDQNKGIPFTYENQRGAVFGFPSLDKMFNGALGGDLFVLAAKTGEGKTALAIQLARQFSFFHKYKGYYMNAEMREDELVSRLVSPLANAKANEIFYGRLEGTNQDRESKKRRISYAFDQYRQSNLTISQIPDLTLNKVNGLTRQLKNTKGLDYLVIDYIGRMTMNYQMNLWDELYEITKALKKLAQQLDIPVFVLSQRNHDGELEGAKKIKNETDGTLMFEPTNSSDDEFIQNNVRPDDRDKVNYKIIKSKVRRADNMKPIYCVFDKEHNLIREAKTNEF